MISLYEVFKIIFGVVISAFILVLIINYVGVYGNVEKDARKAEIIRNFVKTAGDVYVTGNAIEFSDFAKEDFLLTFNIEKPEGIVSGTGKAEVFFPLLFSLGDRLFISRSSLDMGWWSFPVVEAMPKTKILFAPVDSSPETWSLVRDIVAGFPSSEFFNTKITFGFCSGSQIQENLCGGLCEREGFLLNLASPPTGTSPCSAALPENAKLISIFTGQCPPTFEGICLTPPNLDGIGLFRIAGHQGQFFYKDPFDIGAAVIGGTEDDLYGNSGQTLFEYKNNVFRRELLHGVEIMKKRSQLIGPLYPAAPTSDCQSSYASFEASMVSLSQVLGDENYYKNLGSVTALVTSLKQARQAHLNLVNKGCDS